MKKFYSIQVLRGVAAISVVLYHMLVIEKKYAGGDHFLPGLFRLGQSGVDLFFVISGFIMVTVTSREGKENRPLDFLIHRFSRIYPNYWFYFFVTFAVWLLQPSLVNASQGGQFNFFRSFFLIPSVTLPLVLIAWSLIYEVYFYLIFSLLAGLGRLRMLISLLVWLLFLVNANLLPGTPASPIPALTLSPYAIEFIIGALTALLLSSAVIRRLPRMVFIALSLLIPAIVPLLFDHYYSPNGAAGPLFRQTIVFGVAYGVWVLAMVSVEQRYTISFHPFLVRMGDISYTIYLSHLLILGAIGRIWAGWFQQPGSPWDEVMVFPCMLLVIIMYSHIAHRVIEIPSYRFFIRLFSRRQGYSDKLRPR